MMVWYRRDKSEWQHGHKHAARLSLSVNFLACVELHSVTILPSSHDPVIAGADPGFFVG
jgi:hypothetical protein